VGDLFPQAARNAVARAARLGDHDPARIALLRCHYESWRRKWGWDPINPDMDAILGRYGGTEVCWRYDAARRQAGEEIIAAWRSR
jgi:hypothetical protein